MELEVWKCEPTHERKGCGFVCFFGTDRDQRSNRKYNCPQCGKRATFGKVGVMSIAFDPEGK